VIDLGTRRLWQAVLIRAIQDAMWVDRKPTNKLTGDVVFFSWAVSRQTANRMRDEAVFWLLVDNPDFAQVCDAAGVTPTVVRKGVQTMMEASDEQKLRWHANGFQVSDLWGAGDARPACVDPQGSG
jgi:hypothetical protein